MSHFGSSCEHFQQNGQVVAWQKLGWCKTKRIILFLWSLKKRNLFLECGAIAPMETQRTPSVTRLKYVLLLDWCCNAKPSAKIKDHCLSQTGQSTTWWWKKAAVAKFQSMRETFYHLTLMDVRRFTHIMFLSYFLFSNFSFSVVCKVLGCCFCVSLLYLKGSRQACYSCIFWVTGYDTNSKGKWY